MSAALLGLACALASTIGLAWLAATDPKRQRGHEALPARRGRLLAAALAFVPGLWLAGTGRGVAFLIWIGAAAVLGWAVAALANLPGPAAPARTMTTRDR